MTAALHCPPLARIAWLDGGPACLSVSFYPATKGTIMTTVPKLYRVHTVVPEFEGCKDVHFHWFREGVVSPPRPYADLIENYDPQYECAHYAEGCLDELFAEDEANQLKNYIEQEQRYVHCTGITTLHEEELPISADSMGIGALPVGGGDDFLVVYERPGYPLPFKSLAYYTLVGCERLDGSDAYHHRLLLFGPDGFRMETNEEAASRRWRDARSDSAE
jgi:hypothetical protein